MPHDIFVLELDRTEVSVLRKRLRGERHEALIGIDGELAELKPHKGFIIEAPANAVDHIRLVSGGALQTRLPFAIISNDGAKHQRPAIVERDIAYVARMIMAQRARDVVREFSVAVAAAQAALAEHVNTPELDAITPQPAIDAVVEAGMNALAALKKLR